MITRMAIKSFFPHLTKSHRSDAIQTYYDNGIGFWRNYSASGISNLNGMNEPLVFDAKSGYADYPQRTQYRQFTVQIGGI